MVNHGLITGALFLLVGVIYERTHDRTIAKLGGLAGPMPIYAVAFGFFAFASAGLPGLSGFVGEFLSLVGGFLYNPWVAAVATPCMILAAAYLLWMYQRLFFGELSSFLRGLGGHLADMTPVEILTLAPLGALVVAFGVFPGLLLNLVGGSVTNVLNDVASATPIAIAPEAAAIAIAIPIVYVVLRVIYVTVTDMRDPLEAGGAAR
jgi:NADH-quinone oxidoreductase subunit M